MGKVGPVVAVINWVWITGRAEWGTFTAVKFESPAGDRPKMVCVRTFDGVAGDKDSLLPPN